VSDESAGWLAKQDQWQATVENMAGLVGTYYHTLRRCGVPRDVAAGLTMQYQGVMLTAGRGESSGECADH
jgi:hypothetical protein